MFIGMLILNIIYITYNQEKNNAFEYIDLSLMYISLDLDLVEFSQSSCLLKCMTCITRFAY